MLAKLSVDQALIKAKSYAKKGEVAEAEKIYLSILKNFSKNQRALKGLESLNYVKGKNDSKGLPQEIINELLKLHNKGDSLSVFHRSQILTKQYPDSFILWNIFGVSAAQLKKFEKAIDAFKKSISLKPDYAEAYNNLGNVFKDQGKLDEAINAYKNSISLKPDYIEAYLNFGITSINLGKIDDAIKSFKTITLIKPDYAEAFNKLGFAFQEQGKFEDAIEAYKKYISIVPNNAFAYYNLGNVLQKQDKFNYAIDAYNEAIKINPNYAEAYCNLGVALKSQGMLKEAIEAYKKSILLKPSYYEAYQNMGLTLLDQNNPCEAIESFKKVISIKPNDYEAYNNLGVTLKNQEKLDESIDALMKSISFKPDNPIAYNNLGNAYKEQGKLDEAIESYKKSILLDPDYAEAHSNLGVALKDQGKFDDAIVASNKSTTLNPNRAETYNNRGNIFHNQGKLDEAIRSYKQSILLDPDYAEAHNNLSFTLFNSGKYQEALNEYEWRWKTDHFLKQHRHFSQPQWNKKTSLNGKTILIWSEQGVGDTITWSSCLSYISSQAKHCILECQKKLVPLLKRSFPNIEVKAEDRSRDKERDDFDFHIPMGSLYKNLSEEILQKTKVDAYLIPDQERVDYWKKRLNSLGNGPYIGVCWKSSNLAHERLPHYASISDLSQVLMLPNLTLINLQYDDFEKDLIKIRNELGVTVHNFEDIDHYNDLDDVAALCTALDIVVSTKTTVPYISAAVGTLTKLANWKQSPWNNILSNLNGPNINIYERNTWETWDNVFVSIADDILKIKDFKYQKENILDYSNKRTNL